MTNPMKANCHVCDDTHIIGISGTDYPCPACVIPALKARNADLLAALEAIDRGFMDGSIRFTKKRQSDTDPYHPANTLMSAVLAEAKAKP